MMRVNDLARERGVKSRAVLDYLGKIGIERKSHSSTLDDHQVERVRAHFRSPSVQGKNTGPTEAGAPGLQRAPSIVLGDPRKTEHPQDMASGSQVVLARVFVYVDGFNFYWATRGTDAYPYGWCDWRSTAEKYCGQTRSVARVKYFTSAIMSRDDAKRRRQDLHIAAMKQQGADVIRSEERRVGKECRSRR